MTPHLTLFGAIFLRFNPVFVGSYANFFCFLVLYSFSITGYCPSLRFYFLSSCPSKKYSQSLFYQPTFSPIFWISHLYLSANYSFSLRSFLCSTLDFMNIGLLYLKKSSLIDGYNIEHGRHSYEGRVVKALNKSKKSGNLPINKGSSVVRKISMSWRLILNQ